jgi:putative hydrolase of the HAD superfamily
LSFKALMVDVDGVVVRPGFPQHRWDRDLQADLGIDPAALQAAFFATRLKPVSLGQARIEDELAAALGEIAPHVGVETLLTYWFDHDAQLDAVLLADLEILRASGVELHLATVQEHRRAAHLWETLDLKRRFDGLHHSAAVGLAKPDPDYFRALETRTGFAAADIAFIDDSPRNVEAAIAVGWRAAVWTGEQRLADVLREIG